MVDEPVPDQPLAGLRVVELATGISGPYAGKLLGDFGAEVIKVEPIQGDWARSEGVRPGARPALEESPLFLHLNTNKRSVVADLSDDDGRALIRRLLANADVLIDSNGPAELEEQGLSPAQLRAEFPKLVITSVTPFGQSGPYADLPAGELVTYALGGPMLATGDPEREPIKMAGNVVQHHAGSVAALATMAAVSMVGTTGQGTHVDVSNFETQAASIDRRATLAVGYQFDGRNGMRVGGGRVGAIPAGIYPADDGYCQIVFAPNWMPRVAEMLDDEELKAKIAEPDWYDDEDVPDLLNAALFTWTLQRSKQNTMLDAQERQLAITPVNSTTDTLADPHFRERSFWQRWEHPVVGSYEGAGAPFRLRNGWQARRRPPLLGEHTAEVIAELDAADQQAPDQDAAYQDAEDQDATYRDVPNRNAVDEAASADAASASSNRSIPAERSLPLEGVTVLDLTVVWAGPLCTTLLSDLGAEVIRLDNPNLFPTATRGAVPRPRPGREAEFGDFWGRFPGGEGGDRPWNRVAAFVCHSRNKLGATLDLRTELGRDTFLDLVDKADIIVENNSLRVLASLDLDWDVLHARNPELIALRMPSLGLTGPYRDFIGFGAHMEALCGLSSLRGYPDLDPTSLDTTYFMDPASGVTGAFAVLCALRRRSQTGQGELIEFAQAENLMNYIGDYLIDASIVGSAHECHGNRHPHRAPQGAYPCAGDDEWVVLSVADDEQWRQLKVVLGSPPWAASVELANEEGRRIHHDEIDEHLKTWTKGRSAADAVRRLRAAGIPAAPALSEAGLYADEHLRQRGWFRPNSCADVPETLFPGHQWRWDGPELRWSELNMMGRDNDYVFGTVLGRTDEQLDALRAEGHFADGYRDSDGQPL